MTFAAVEKISKKAAQRSKKKVKAKEIFFLKSDETSYQVIIKNVMPFELAMDHISLWMTFIHTAEAIQYAKDRTKTGKLAGSNDLIYGQYIRVMVVTAFQNTSGTIGHTYFWAI